MRYVSGGKFWSIVEKEIENLKCNSDTGITYLDNEDWEGYEDVIEQQAIYNVKKKYCIKKEKTT